MNIRLLIPMILIGLTTVNSSESEAGSIVETTGSSFRVIKTLSTNDDVRAMYSAVFDRLAATGHDLLNLLEELRLSSPQVNSAVTKRWNSPAEKLSYKKYRQIFITNERLTAGKKFHDDNRDLIHQICKKYGIDEYVLLAIIGVESMYGQSHADYRVVDVFHTIAHEVPRKRAWAEQELTSFLIFCEDNDLELADIHGSYAGAIGYAQFIPSSLVAYGRDHDGDGIINPYTWEDALESVANYLRSNRYKPGSSDFREGSRNWKSIYAYNHSKNYVKVILELRTGLRKTIEG